MPRNSLYDVPCVNAQSDPHYEESSDGENYQPGLGTLPPGGACNPSPAYSGMTGGGT